MRDCTGVSLEAGLWTSSERLCRRVFRSSSERLQPDLTLFCDYIVAAMYVCMYCISG